MEGVWREVCIRRECWRKCRAVVRMGVRSMLLCVFVLYLSPPVSMSWKIWLLITSASLLAKLSVRSIRVSSLSVINPEAFVYLGELNYAILSVRSALRCPCVQGKKCVGCC